jgi:hypothetical protein
MDMFVRRLVQSSCIKLEISDRQAPFHPDLMMADYNHSTSESSNYCGNQSFVHVDCAEPTVLPSFIDTAVRVKDEACNPGGYYYQEKFVREEGRWGGGSSFTMWFFDAVQRFLRYPEEERLIISTGTSDLSPFNVAIRGKTGDAPISLGSFGFQVHICSTPEFWNDGDGNLVTAMQTDGYIKNHVLKRVSNSPFGVSLNDLLSPLVL